MADDVGHRESSSQSPDVPFPATPPSRFLPLMLAMAMFVLVVDTTIMNVSITAVAESLGSTVSSVQSAIAIEALVSAAFILINSKLGDLMGRKRAYTIGLAAYAVGALAMTLAQGITAIVVFWSLIGGLGASLLLPAMQSLIHGNFEGDARAKVYALVGASMAIAAAIGPLIGGVITTFWSWRVNFALEFVIIVVVLASMRLIKDVPYEGDRSVDKVGALLSVVGMGGVVLGILVWQEGGEAVLALLIVGAIALFGFARWLVRRKREGKAVLLDPGLFTSPYFRIGVTQQMLQQIALGGAMIVIPLFLQISLEYNALEAGLAIAPLSLSMFVIALVAGKRAGRRRPAVIVRAGFGLALIGMVLVIPVVPRAESDQGAWVLLVPLLIAGCGLGLLVSQLNNYTLAPIEDERASEAAGVNSAGGNFGLSFGLAMASGIMLAVMAFSFTALTDASTVIPDNQKQTIATAMEDNAQIVSDTQLQQLVAAEPPPVQSEIVAINDQARSLSLQVAMLVPVLACLLGFINAFRMVRLPDIEPSAAHEGIDFG